MKREETKQDRPFINVALLLAAVAAVSLGGLAAWLNSRATDMRGRLAASIEHYDRMKDYRARMDNIRKNMSAVPKEEVDASRITTFVSQKAGQSQLPSPGIRVSTPPKSGAWSEIATTVDLRGSREQPVSRAAVVEFLAAIERERPYLKSKVLSFVFSQNDLASAQVVISYFKRD